MFIRAKTGKGNSVVYYDEDENISIWTGGTRAWRNNNPGNIRPSQFSYKNGAIGSAGGFAIFPTYQGPASIGISAERKNVFQLDSL